MAQFHMNAKIIGRSKGGSAVAAAAYRSGEKLRNYETMQTEDYTRKGGVYHSEVMTPKGAPDWASSRENLWNAVERKENRLNSQFAREFDVALPRELTPEQSIQYTRDYVQEQFVDKGMVADVAYHNMEGKNPHAHIMLTTRQLEGSGWAAKKERKWNKRERVNEWRESWAEHTNKALHRHGHSMTIDHRSYQEQGVNRIPGQHLGRKAAAMERKGIETDRGNLNRKSQETERNLRDDERNFQEVERNSQTQTDQQKPQPQDNERNTETRNYERNLKTDKPNREELEAQLEALKKEKGEVAGLELERDLMRSKELDKIDKKLGRDVER